MKKTILLLAVAAGALAVQPAFAHTPAGAGGPPPGVTVGAPAAAKNASHISANGLENTNGKYALVKEHGQARAAAVHADKVDDKTADRAAKALDKSDDHLAKAQDKIDDHNAKPKVK